MATINNAKQYGFISIHAPREGSDMFNGKFGGGVKISIHAPREGSDQKGLLQHYDHQHFYPRSPRGERPAIITYLNGFPHFYPRSPRGERHKRT